MDVRHFYTILPSDSSMIYYPDNTVTCFTTKLPREIVLDGKWEVGLSEISIPLSFFTFNKKVTVVQGDEYDYFTHEFEPRVFGDLKTLMDKINEEMSANKLELSVTENNYSLITYTDCAGEHCSQYYSIEFEEDLRRISGFEKNKIYFDTKKDESYISELPGNINACLPDSVYVYTNICEANIVGDTHATILRTLPINYSKKKFGETYHVAIGSVHYVPLLSNSFREIEIDLRDRLGQPLPFMSGTSYVTLHFRRID